MKVLERIKYQWRARRPELVSGLLYYLVRLLSTGMRYREINMPTDASGRIICGWHGRSAVFAQRYRKRGIWVIISQSRDGEMQARIFTKLGFQIIRGSTGRGGVRAAVESIKALRGGGTMALTPDGPRGPSHEVQGGIMLIAQKSGAEIIPCGVSARPCVFAKSWDRYLVPLPFAKAVLVGGRPFTVPADADEAAVEAIRLELQAEITRVEREADRILGLIR